jgi:hypothetical protein
MRGPWHLTRPLSQRDRRPGRIGPVVEALEDRLVLTGTSPTNVVPIGPQSSGTVTPQQLGAAYQQVVAIQTTTLLSLGGSYRQVQAAGAKFASRATVAIDKLNAELGQSKSQHRALAIVAAISQDRDLLDRGGADVTRVEQGLDVARGLADQQANTGKIYIPNRLILTTLAALVQQDQSTGKAISRSGRRSVNGLVRELNKLGDQLVSTIRVRPSVKD